MAPVWVRVSALAWVRVPVVGGRSVGIRALVALRSAVALVLVVLPSDVVLVLVVLPSDVVLPVLRWGAAWRPAAVQAGAAQSAAAHPWVGMLAGARSGLLAPSAALPQLVRQPSVVLLPEHSSEPAELF